MSLAFITISGAVLTFEAALLLAMGGFGLTAKNIQQLAGTYWGYNPHVVASLSMQRWYSAGGVLLLSLALSLQLYPMLWDTPSAPSIDKAVASTALLSSAAVGVLTSTLCRYMARREQAQVMVALRKNADESARQQT